MKTFLLWFLFFLLGFFGCLGLARIGGFELKPLEVVLVSAPIRVHLYVETAPGTDIYLDKKIWDLKYHY